MDPHHIATAWAVLEVLAVGLMVLRGYRLGRFSG